MVSGAPARLFLLGVWMLHQPLGPPPAPPASQLLPLLSPSFKTNTREPKPPIQPRRRWSPSWN